MFPRMTFDKRIALASNRILDMWGWKQLGYSIRRMGLWYAEASLGEVGVRSFLDNHTWSFGYGIRDTVENIRWSVGVAGDGLGSTQHALEGVFMLPGFYVERYIQNEMVFKRNTVPYPSLEQYVLQS